VTDFLNDVLIPALGVGALYGLVGISFNLIYGPSRTFNFAQGQIVMLGGLLAFSWYEDLGLPLIIVILMIAGVGAAIGAAEERFAVWPALRRNPQGQGWVLSTLAVFTMIQGIAIVRWENIPRVVSSFPGMSLNVESFGSMQFKPYYVGTALIAMGAFVLLHLFFTRTMLGRTVSATAQDREAAALRGIDTRLITTLSFAMGGALAAVTGLVAAPLTLATVNTGLTFTFRGFMASAIGGMGANSGALLGGLVLGLIEHGTTRYWEGGYVNFVMLGGLLTLLLIKPEGLRGQAVARRI
jgi:branched-chain amino acid transport system permease protein